MSLMSQLLSWYCLVMTLTWLDNTDYLNLLLSLWLGDDYLNYYWLGHLLYFINSDLVMSIYITSSSELRWRSQNGNPDGFLSCEGECGAVFNSLPESEKISDGAPHAAKLCNDRYSEPRNGWHGQFFSVRPEIWQASLSQLGISMFNFWGEWRSHSP